jgi:hypothetical protein
LSSERLVPAPSPFALPSTADRERVVQALSLHFAHDHLSLDELESRLATVYQAQTMVELERLVADLRALPADRHDPGSAELVVSADAVPERGVMMALMGGFGRKGSWVVPRHLKLVAVMGGGELDLRRARFAPGVTEIEVFTLMGGIEIVVPPGVRVEMLGAAFMAGFETDTDDAPSPGPAGPVLRVTGLAVMAGVEVKVRRPGKKMLAKFEAAWKAARQLRGAPPNDD